MQDIDLEATKALRNDFQEITRLIENDFAAGVIPIRKLMNLYTVVYTAATRSKLSHVDEHYAAHKELYQLSQDMLTEYMHAHADELLQNLHNWPQERIFNAVVRRWHNYKPAKRWIARTFGYLSRFYIEHQDMPSLEAVALRIFFRQLFKHVIPVMRNTILSLVQRERDGETIDRGAVQAGIELFSKMSVDSSVDVYHREFLSPYIEATGSYYEKTGLLWIATESATDYLIRVEDKLNEEKMRCKLYFNAAAEKEIVEHVAQELLGAHQKALLHKSQSGFASCLRDARSEHIRRFWTLFGLIKDGLAPLAQLLRDHCLTEGLDILKNHARPRDAAVDFRGFVTDIVGFHQKYAQLLQNELGGLPAFQVAVKEAIECVVNKGVTVKGDNEGEEGKVSCCELLALYCDNVIRQGTDKEETDGLFDSVIGVLMFVADKDVFQQHARDLLCRRLLTGVTSKEREEPLMTRLKDKLGLAFTSHFEGMLNDRDVSQEFRERFRDFCVGASIVMTFDFSCYVLTTGFWPSFTTDEARPPPAVLDMMATFERFYTRDKGQKRVLKWSHTEGTALIAARFASDKELQMTPMQACVLLLFNTDAERTLEELQQESGAELDDLRRILGSLLRTKLLIRQDTTFAVNTAFTSQRRKLVVAPPQAKISAAHSRQVTSNVEEDRKGAIDACLVRIMKSRRTLAHQDLVAECVQHLRQRFSPDARFIKARIEELINREYLEREGAGYVYKA